MLDAWITAGICLLLGLIGVALRPKALTSWWFCIGMSLLSAECVLDRQLSLAALGSVGKSYSVGMPILLLKSLIPGTWLGFSLIYGRGKPNRVWERWKWFLVPAVLAPAGMVWSFREGILNAADTGQTLMPQLTTIGKTWVVLLLCLTLGVLVNLEQTFRASIGMTRWRIKYLILGLALIFGVRVYTSTQMLLFSTYHPEFAHWISVSLLLGCIMIATGLVRSGYGKLDIYPSRAVLQGSVTLILAGVYFLSVGLLANWVKDVGGSNTFPAQALVLLLGAVGVAVMLLSERFRTALHRFVSRHFRRPEHDYRKIWTELTRRVSSVLDAATLGKNAAELISESFHVLGVTVFRIQQDPPALEWLHSTEKRGMGSVPTTSTEGLNEIARLGHPFDLEKERGDWVESLKGYCPRKFDHGGNRLALPLAAGDRLVGLIILADRVNGVPYSHEELDLLKCISDHLAAALLNCSLTEEILQAKELEAFQTLSSFFVHDLKNAANGLSLMLQNLPNHFDDPEFRSDIIRGAGRTVERINQLILKLGSLRRELQLNPSLCQLDLLCAEALDGLDAMANGHRPVTRELLPVPMQALDREAMKSVVTNLVLNAWEALDHDGQVRVATRPEGGSAVLEVIDDGCGMSPEFVKTKLFRPFHTTKTKGLGIGMFQCKKIIEAHGGRVLVESQPGTGTRFTVLVPLCANSQPEPTPA